MTVAIEVEMAPHAALVAVEEEMGEEEMALRHPSREVGHAAILRPSK